MEKEIKQQIIEQMQQMKAFSTTLSDIGIHAGGLEKEKFDAIMQDIEMEVQARLNEKEKTEKTDKKASGTKGKASSKVSS